MRSSSLVETWKLEESQPFTGWDFEHLDERMVEELPPWSYMDRAAELMSHSDAILDMGTGGGERLLDLREYWPEIVVATEDYLPNLKLVRGRLETLGVRVEKVELSRKGSMPFDDQEFDLVLNRHSGFNCSEVARILAPGGTFLTQQVHGLWAQDLLAEFGASPQWPDSTMEYYLPRLESSGLNIMVMQEWEGNLTFRDVGAIVYYLKAVPWLVPGFSVEKHIEDLVRLQNRLDSGDELIFSARKYLLEAQKPG